MKQTKKRGNIIFTSKTNYYRQLMSMVLSLVLVVGLFAMPTYANIQIPVDSINVDNIYYIVGENVVTGESMISPTMNISWEDPESWANATDIADIHEPDFYTIEVNNLTTGEDNEINVPDGSTAFTNHALEVHESTSLDTGSLYEVKALPFHYHEFEGVENLAPTSGLAKSAYAITDLQVGFESDEDTITVIWDNLGVAEFQYRIVYALGDFSSQTKQALLDNKEGEISGITVDSDDVSSFYDPITKRNKLSYTIDENIYPGQVYSVMVEPIVEYYQGLPVTRNRNYPVINNVSTNILLSYSEEGEQLRLQWEIPASFKVGSNNDEYELVESKLIRYRDGQGQSLAIFNGIAGAVGYYTLNKPLVETGYQLELTYKAVDDESKPAITPISNYLVFSPTLVEVVPTKPVIPEFISEEILDGLTDTLTTEQVRDKLAADYLVPGSTYLGNMDDLFEENITYHFDGEDSAINLAWSAFRRIDIDQSSPTYNEYITDLATYYDIWMTNSYDSLSYATRFLADQRFSSSDESVLIKSESGTIVGYHMRLDGFYNAENGEFETIRPNQIYYIKLVAKKKVGDTEITSEPTVVTFYYTDEGATYVPPLITKPPLRVKEDASTPTSLTLAWKENWFEVLDPLSNPGDPLSEWSNQVWVTPAGVISTLPIEDAIEFKVYESIDEVNRLQTYLNTLGLGITLEHREIDLGRDPFGISNIYYKFLKIDYVDVAEAIEEMQLVDPTYSFLEYFDQLVKNDKSGLEELDWKKIIATTNPDDIEEMVYQESGLLPNTSYMFVLYPYRVLYNDVELNAHYPTPIIVATEPEETEINPDPTVPSMYITDYTDRTVTLSWQYNTDFEYEIRYSTEDDSATAIPVSIDLPTNINDPDYPKDGEYYEVTISDLFPDTGYYFFIRARQNANNTTSLWSNPIFGLTRDIETPAPPLGIGVPPIATMKEYDYDLAVSEDYIAISWLKNTDDNEEINEGKKVKVYYSYILEAANNKNFIGPQYIVSGETDTLLPDNVELLEKNLVKVNELISNRYYYFRMKTRVTIVGDQEEQVIVKESDYYSPTLKIITIASDNEYDSESDPALEILPSENFEIIYDQDKQQLTYRFRDNGTDANGNADNNVDQRLISDLIKRNLYEYEIDIANFDNKPITSRKVQIPYSIIEAFDSQEIELKIDAGHMLINVPHDALLSEVNRQKNQYGVAPLIEFNIDDVDNYYENSRMPENALTSVSVPQEMSIKVKSSRVNKTLSYSDVPLEIGLSTSSRYQVYGKTPIVYSLDSNQNWDKMSGKYDRSEGAYMLATKNIGSYGVFLMEGSNEIKSSVPTHWSESYKAKIDDKYTVLGMTGYNPNSYVKEDEFINIVYHLVKKQDEIDVSQYVSSEQLKSLYYAGIKTDESKGATTLNREEAVAMMMRTLEIRDKLTLAADVNKIALVNSNAQIDTKYRDLIAKAATIGLVSDLNALRPNDKLTYAELFALWAKAEGL